MDRQAENKDEGFGFQQENILQHMGLIKNTAKRMTEMIPQEMPWEDVLQYGCIGLLTAMHSYNKEKGEFSTLAVLHIYGSILEGIYAFRGEKRLRKARRRSKYRLHLSAPKEDWTLQENLRLEEERQERAQEAVEERLSLRSALRKLTPEEQKMVEAVYFQNKTCRMYAVETQRSVQWVQVMHRRVLKKLRQWLLN